MQYVKTLRNKPIAIETAIANTQHYEVGTGVLKACLGPRMKYSSCLYPNGTETLGQAEIEMLETYVERAGLTNGMKILDLGWVNRPHVGRAEEHWWMACEAVAGVPVHFSSQKYFQRHESLPSPTRQRRKNLSMTKQLWRDLPMFKWSSGMWSTTNLKRLFMIGFCQSSFSSIWRTMSYSWLRLRGPWSQRVNFLFTYSTIRRLRMILRMGGWVRISSLGGQCPVPTCCIISKKISNSRSSGGWVGSIMQKHVKLETLHSLATRCKYMCWFSCIGLVVELEC